MPAPRPSEAAGPWVRVSLVGFAFTVTMLGTTLPTPLYPALGRQFGFGELMTTVIFAIYPLGVTTALLVLGRWSDQLGRRPLLYGGLACSALSAVVLVFHASLGWIYLARVLSGLSAGIFTGTATATIVDLTGAASASTAGLVAAAANMGGLGLGPLVAGLLAQWAPDPLTLPFLVDLGLIALAVGCLAIVPETVDRVERPDLRPQGLGVPAEVRAVFLPAAIAGFAGFAVMGLFGAVSPGFLGEVLHRSSPALTGVVACSVFAASVLGQIVSVRLSTERALPLGCVGLVVGMGLVGLSLPLASLLVLETGGLVAGLGQGLSFRAGLASVTAASPAGRRSEVTSAFFVSLYVGIAVPVVGEGLVATALGLVTAGLVFAGLVGLLAVTVLVLLLRRTRSGLGQPRPRRGPTRG